MVWPHLGQKRAPSRNWAPQCTQNSTGAALGCAVPQVWQKAAPATTTVPHCGQAGPASGVAAVAAAALAGNSPEFQEGLPLTVLGLQARAGEPGADQELDRHSSQIQAAAAELTAALAAEPWERGEGDSWGSHKRWLVALAELRAILFDDRPMAIELLDQALDLPYGFAGFQSPACLTLAEAVRVCCPAGADTVLAPSHGVGRAIDRALHAAQTAAHNVQDVTFCARTTARFNAMNIRWWGWPPAGSDLGFDLEDAVERLCQDSATPDFAALHLVGERYQYRSSGPNWVELPPQMRGAHTLEMLAGVYQRPLADFLRLNQEQGWAADEPLPEATAVNVPDPGFPPLLAARFAAEALADPALSPDRRVTLIQSLVPVAAANPTALATVLSRLLLAVRPGGRVTLDVLLKMAAPGWGSQGLPRAG